MADLIANKMKTYISLLRGINVSGQKLIKMDALKQMFSELNFKNIQTYIQSGNVIFQNKELEHERLEKTIADKILERFGFEVPVMVRDLDDLSVVLKNNPFVTKRNENITKLHVTFLSKLPEQTDIAKINADQYLPDEFILTGSTIYLFCPNGYGRTKLNNTFFESKFKAIATTRNWKTIKELYSIAEKQAIAKL